MDVGDWLRELNLEQYEAAFHANDVDAEVLPTLTADDLKDMGITSIGHRRRLLEAIARLRIKAAPENEVPPPHAPLRSPQEDKSEYAVRRRSTSKDLPTEAGTFKDWEKKLEEPPSWVKLPKGTP
jgi:SAM domain (Sterile alpha motif)